MKYKSMTLQEHIDCAKDLSIAGHHLRRLALRIQKHYPKSHRLCKLAFRMLPGAFSSKWFMDIKSELDSEYHKVITDRDFEKYGHIYYELGKLYLDDCTIIVSEKLIKNWDVAKKCIGDRLKELMPLDV